MKLANHPVGVVLEGADETPSLARMLSHLPLADVIRVIAPWSALVLERQLDAASLAYERQQLERGFGEEAARWLTDAERQQLVDAVGYALNEYRPAPARDPLEPEPRPHLVAAPCTVTCDADGEPIGPEGA